MKYFLAIICLFSSLQAVEEKPAAFTHPGVAAFRQGSWIGRDHLLNLSKEIYLVFEIVNETGHPLPIDEDAIKAAVAQSFKKAGLMPQMEKKEVSIPLPFFHLLVLITETPQGYIALINGRLFEEVKIDRATLPEGVVWQAITWDSQTLMTSPKKDLAELLKKNALEISGSFIERYRYFETQMR